VRSSEILGRRCGEYVIGGAQLGLAYGTTNVAGRPSRVRVRDMLDAAARGGATTIDTAAAYGRSETVIGRIFAESPALRSRLWVITKLHPRVGDRPASAARLATETRRVIHGSLRRLRLEHLPLVLLHRPTQRTIGGGAIRDAMVRLVETGAIGAIGVSVYTPAEALAALEDPSVRAIQAPLNVFDRAILTADIPARCAAAGVVIFVRSVFLQGLLAGDQAPPPSRSSRPSTRVPQAVLEAAQRFRTLAQGFGRPPDALALAFVRSVGGLAGVVLGAETEAQVMRNLALFEESPLSAAESAALIAALPSVPEALLNPAGWAST
jgi:spore coat polysaccharide biosynthesis protein SpsF